MNMIILVFIPLKIYTLEDLKWDGKSRTQKSSRDNVTDK